MRYKYKTTGPFELLSIDESDPKYFILEFEDINPQTGYNSRRKMAKGGNWPAFFAEKLLKKAEPLVGSKVFVKTSQTTKAWSTFEWLCDIESAKTGYEVVTMTDQSGTIPLGQKELTTGSLYTGTSSSTINDLGSTRQYDQEYTFTSTSDSSVTISKELDVAYYYHADLSEPSDMDSTQFGVNGYTKVVYGNNSSEFTQLNTSRAALEPQ